VVCAVWSSLPPFHCEESIPATHSIPTHRRRIQRALRSHFPCTHEHHPTTHTHTHNPQGAEKPQQQHTIIDTTEQDGTKVNPPKQESHKHDVTERKASANQEYRRNNQQSYHPYNDVPPFVFVPAVPPGPPALPTVDNCATPPPGSRSSVPNEVAPPAVGAAGGVYEDHRCQP